jgi:hypothetical protein
MSPLTLSLIVFICVFGGALAGIALRAILPEHHLSTDSRDVVKLGAGLVGTMAALVLGLMVASAKDSYQQVTRGLFKRLDSVIAYPEKITNPRLPFDHKRAGSQLLRARYA